MHLFKSQWLQEPAPRAATSSYRDPTFGPRHGRHAAAPRAHPPAMPASYDSIVTVRFEAERQILRAMARYDHAA